MTAPANHYVAQRGAKLLKRFGGSSNRRPPDERLSEASQWRLMLTRFRKHRLAQVSLFLLVILYVVALLAEFVAPYDAGQRFEGQLFAGPTKIQVIDDEGNWRLPFFYATTSKATLPELRYRPKRTEPATTHGIVLFAKSEPYKLLGLVPFDRHLFGTADDQPVFLLGADHLGRDVFSRIIFASRVSLLVGFGGVLISFLIGIVLGSISGYFGGFVDNVIQRGIDFIISLPLIPLWMALSVAVPRDWTGVQRYFAITLILSLVGWTTLARVVRGKVISLREEDYVTAARISSAGTMSIIGRHLLPGVVSFLIVYVTIAIPGMILGETTLSFLGLGILPPDVSWGSLLQQAQDVTAVSNYTWLLAPALFLSLAVVLFNFIGDGLRDAADPYSR